MFKEDEKNNLINKIANFETGKKTTLNPLFSHPLKCA